jgi:NADPH-dependent F420 reductase
VSAPIAIVGGTGDLGYGLALRLARAGTPVTIGSRDAARAAAAAERVREILPEGDATGRANPDAVAGAEVVVLSVPFAGHAATLKSLKDALVPGQVLLDATVPLATAIGGRPTRVLGVPQGSAAQQAQELAPDGVTVVSALHTVSAAHLADLDHAFEEDVLVCGDDPEAKRRVGELVALIPGLRAVDAGKLEMARVAEQLTALLISINVRHEVSAGVKITGLP